LIPHIIIIETLTFVVSQRLMSALSSAWVSCLLDNLDVYDLTRGQKLYKRFRQEVVARDIHSEIDPDMAFFDAWWNYVAGGGSRAVKIGGLEIMEQRIERNIHKRVSLAVSHVHNFASRLYKHFTICRYLSTSPSAAARDQTTRSRA
jgi:hypothetical protein